MSNPLLDPWDGPFGLPDFARIRPEHFLPAFDAALAGQQAEFDAIATSPEPPTFANTIEALERSGRLLDRVGAIFWNLAGSDTNEEIQAIEREIGPRISQHVARQLTDPRMFARIEAVVANPGRLTAEQARVLDLVHQTYVRAGARLVRGPPGVGPVPGSPGSAPGRPPGPVPGPDPPRTIPEPGSGPVRAGAGPGPDRGAVR